MTTQRRVVVLRTHSATSACTRENLAPAGYRYADTPRDAGEANPYGMVVKPKAEGSRLQLPLQRAPRIGLQSILGVMHRRTSQVVGNMHLSRLGTRYCPITEKKVVQALMLQAGTAAVGDTEPGAADGSK